MVTTDARIVPVFRYANAPATLAWLERVFGFTRHEVFEGPDGSIAHAELRLDGDAIAVSSAGPALPDNPWTAVRAGIYICLKDVDGVHASTRAAGTAIARPITDMDYGAREYSARDAAGHLWSVGTYMMGERTSSRRLFIDLHYDAARAAIDELTRSFGFAVALEVPDQTGGVAHAELRLGTDTLMISGGPRTAGDLWGVDTQCTHVVVDDPDAHHAQAAAQGATVLLAPHTTPYGARAYYVRDPENFVWGFSTYSPS
jgi:uncharacterized glyoxalase superfamily protein PhnB